jgi:uncharacterized membrane protein
MFLTHNTHFGFLFWNLFLAIIPFWISNFLIKNETTHFQKYSLLVICILFLPNAPYLITDLIHLKEKAMIPFCIDALIFFVFAFLGLWFWIAAVTQICVVLKLPHQTIFYFQASIAFSSGFGIYLGRILRFNSWEVFSNPQKIASPILQLFIHPFRYSSAWVFSILLALMLMFSLQFIHYWQNNFLRKQS